MKEEVEIKCDHCKKEFKINKRNFIRSKTHCCSLECRRNIPLKRVKIKCKICNSTYEVKPSRENTSKTCSKKCFSMITSINKSGNKNSNFIDLPEFEKFFYIRARQIRNKCSTKGLEFNIDYNDLIDIYNKQNGKCYYSNIELKPINKKMNYDTLSFDRLDSSKGYTKDNIVLCLLCLNYFKSNFNIEDIKKVFNAISLTNKVIVPVEVQLNNGVNIPSKSNEEDAGSDLIVNNIIEENDYKIIVGTGVRIQPKGNYYGEVYNRSSNHKKGIYLANNVGIIDKTYTGEIILVFFKSPDYKGLEIGDKVAQLILKQQLFINFIEVESLNKTDRGEGGFGSTGN